MMSFTKTRSAWVGGYTNTYSRGNTQTYKKKYANGAMTSNSFGLMCQTENTYRFISGKVFNRAEALFLTTNSHG